MLSSLDHVILVVRDLDAAVRAYTPLLGRTPSWRGEHPGAGTQNALYRLENTYLELLSPVGEGPVAASLTARLEMYGEGLAGLAFATSDIQSCRRSLSEHGLEPGEVESGLGRDVDSGAFRRWQTVGLPLKSTRGIFLFAIEHETPEGVLSPAGFLGDGEAAVSGLDHVVVNTGDAEAARALYGEGLGLRLALDKEFPQWGARMLFFRVGGVTVEVVSEFGKTDSGEAPARDRSSDQLFGLCWRVPDADRARTRLHEQGLDVSPVRKGRKPGTRVFTLRDGSCGVPTLIVEPV